MCELLAKSSYLGENHEIEKYASRLRQFDTFGAPSMNEYGNDNIFIIIFGSGYSNWREIRGKLLSVTTHRIYGKLNTDLALNAPTLEKNDISHYYNLLCWCLMSHQQLRSYGDMATALLVSIIRQTGETEDQPATPGLHV